MFSNIVGNEHIKGYLARLIEKKRIGHSLLFAGPEGIGKSLFAEAFAKLLLSQNDPTGSHLFKLNAGTHPDLHIYKPEGKIGMHSISAMRALSEEVYLPPYEAERKVFIIHDADRMLSYSANALLKTFEEPSKETVILLLSSAPELLLPTILSRCSAFHFHALNEEEMMQLLTTKKNLSLEQAKKITGLSQGSVSKAFRLCQQSEDPMREKVLSMLSIGKFDGYNSLTSKAKELAEVIDSSIKMVESISKEELLKGYCDKLTAAQRESVEKEIEGAAAIHLIKEADALFDLLITWHRDLHLLNVGGDHRHLFHPDYLQEMQKVLARKGALLPLEELFEAIKISKLSLARSTAMPLCLENLFLRLNML